MTAKDEALLSVAVVLLAAGASSRMGGQHKLLAEFGGVPLIRKSALVALACGADRVVAVTGYRHADIAAAISDLDIAITRNEDHASGMAHSLRLGVAAAQQGEPDGIMIMLADMPALTGAHLNLLITTFRSHGGTSVVRASAGDKSGNPVIFPPSLYRHLLQLEGDRGARQLLAFGDVKVVDVEIGEAALIDVDTTAEVIAAGGILPSKL